MTKVMFLDESGDHNLDPKKVDDSYPVFVLAGCIFEEKYYNEIAVPKIKDLKTRFFEADDIIFHTAEMIRPTKAKDKRFISLIDAKFRKEFYFALNTLIGELDFSLVACVIKKKEHWDRYGLSAMDPYLLSFDNILNCFMFQIHPPEQGNIYAEKRNSILDNQLDVAWLNAKVSGTELVKSTEIKAKIDNFKMVLKSKNEVGLQIADLVASPIGRSVLKSNRKEGNEVDMSVLETKFIKKNEEVMNFGLTILPK